MSWKPSKRLAFWSVLFALLCPAACGSSGVVGGDCAASAISCDGRCVDAQNDPDHCGGCEQACQAGVACHNAVCGGTLPNGSSGASNNGESGEAGTSGSSGNSGGSGTGTNAGEGGDDLDAGELSDAKHDADASCVPPYKRPEACGNCATKCSKAAPTCSPDGMGSYVCVLICDDPLKQCNGQCVDFNIDAENCGRCGNVCPSGICQGGQCVGANVGHVVVACMDYQTPTSNSAQSALLGNAILLPIRNPLRILAYTEYAPASERAKVDQNINIAAAARARTASITALGKYTGASAALNIGNYDVFLIYDQTAAPAGRLATVGSAWQKNSVLDSFASAGGVVIALSGGKSEMDQFLTNSELLDVSAETALGSVKLYNRAPADALGINLISPFLALADTCTFTTSVTADAADIFVVQDAASPAVGSPVVVHRVIEP